MIIQISELIYNAKIVITFVIVINYHKSNTSTDNYQSNYYNN